MAGTDVASATHHADGIELVLQHVASQLCCLAYCLVTHRITTPADLAGVWIGVVRT